MTNLKILSDRLQALGVQLGAKDIHHTAKNRDNHHLLSQLGGSINGNKHGNVFIIETNHFLNRKNIPGEDDLSNFVNLFYKDYFNKGIKDINLGNFYFFDTETTSLGTGSGTIIFLYGIACIKNDNINLLQYFLHDPAQEIALLQALEKQFLDCQVLVTYNGKSFDVPILKNRYLIQGCNFPLDDIINMDLLWLTRRLWKNRLVSRSLLNIENQILKIQRSHDDIPGWMIPKKYFDYLHYGDTDDLPKIIYHNAMDIISLVHLFLHMSSLLLNPNAAMDDHIDNILAIGKIYEDFKDYETAKLFYNRITEENTPEEYKAVGFYRLGMIYKYCGDYETANSFWESAAKLNNVLSCIELAKYNEHRLKNYRKAIYWTQSAIKDVTNTNDNSELYIANELEYRLNRLKRIIGEYN